MKIWVFYNYGIIISSLRLQYIEITYQNVNWAVITKYDLNKIYFHGVTWLPWFNMKVQIGIHASRFLHRQPTFRQIHTYHSIPKAAQERI